MQKDSKIFVAGHSGLAGSAVVRELKRKGYTNIVGYRVDLTNRDQAFDIFYKELPEYVFNCAAHAGGIMEAITKPGDMLMDNILIQANLTEMCKEFGVKKFLNVGSSCIYPVDGEQPYREEQLGTGKTDENWSYAVAKLAGIEMCRSYHKQYGCNFMTVIPCNMYGINDNFGDNGHVIPMLIRKFHEDEFVEIWGDGSARREFLYVDDFADAAVMLMEEYDYNDLSDFETDGVVNLGYGQEIGIGILAEYIRDILEIQKPIVYNEDKPSGVKSKLLDNYIMEVEIGWKPKTSLGEGIRETYEWYVKNCASN